MELLSNREIVSRNQEIPENRGSLANNSPNMHPTAHKSIDLSYLLLPNNNSGALYHLQINIKKFSCIVKMMMIMMQFDLVPISLV
jgi:hypothetical protein